MRRLYVSPRFWHTPGHHEKFRIIIGHIRRQAVEGEEGVNLQGRSNKSTMLEQQK